MTAFADHFGYCPACDSPPDGGFNVYDHFEGEHLDKGTVYLGCSRCKTLWSVGSGLLTQRIYSPASAQAAFGEWRNVEPRYHPTEPLAGPVVATWSRTW